MWLQPLADKFARLALQLLARFAAWLGAGMDARSVAAIGGAAALNDADPAQPSTMVRGAPLTHMHAVNPMRCKHTSKLCASQPRAQLQLIKRPTVLVIILPSFLSMSFHILYDRRLEMTGR